MAKLIFFTFQFLLFCFALLGKKQFICGEESNSDSYDTLLKNIKFSKNDLNILLNEKLLSSIRDLITYEILAYHFKDSKPTNSYLINKIKKKILVNYPALDLNETFYENLESLIDNLKQSQGSDVEKFIQDIYDEKLDIIKQFIIYEKLYKNLESQIHDENKVLDIVYRNFSELLHNSNNDENITNDDNSVEKQYNIKNSLKESLTILQFYINIFNKFNNNLLEFKNKANLLITYHENQPQSLKYKPIANQLKEIIKTLTLRLRSDVSDLSDKYKLKLKIIERELSYIFPTTTNKHVPRIDMEFIYDKNTNLNLTDVKNKYEDIIASIDSDLNINTKNKYFFFNILILLLKKYTTWIDKQDPDVFFEKNDAKEVFELGFIILAKVIHAFTLKYDELIKLYEKLHASINIFLYTGKYDPDKDSYNSLWDKIITYNANDFLSFSDEIYSQLYFLNNKIHELVSTSKTLNKNSIKELNEINENLNSLRFHLSFDLSHFYQLTNCPIKLHNIKEEIEKIGNEFRITYINLKLSVNAFKITLDKLKTKVDNILKLISKIINHDKIIEEFKNMKQIWKAHVNYKSNYFKNNNMFAEEYANNKNVIFPPEFNLENSSSVNNNVNKNVLSSIYFISLYEYVINKLDALETQDKMYKYYSTIYTSIDLVIDYIKSLRKKWMTEYYDQREKILQILKIKKYIYNKTLKKLPELSAFEIQIMYLTDMLLMRNINFVEMNKYIKEEGINQISDLILYEKKVLQINNLKENIFFSNRTINSLDFKEKLLNEKLPSYYYAVESFITKYFLTISKWWKFIDSNKEILPIELTYESTII